MSIINSANPGSQINLLCMIYRIIQRNNDQLTTEEMLKLCRPDNLPTKDDHKKRLGDNLRFWMNESHQVWTIDSQDKIGLLTKSKTATPEDVAAAASDALYAEKYDDIYASKNHDTYPLFRCLGAILAVDQYTIGLDKTLSNKELEDLFSRTGLKYPPNDSEKKYVLAYGHFLGYLEAIPDGGYVVDVTRAVRRVIRKLFESNHRLDANTFLAQLGARLPMLDGGAYRQQIVDQMKKASQTDSGPREISTALSLALERLRLDGIIAREAKADDPEACFLHIGRTRIPVSQIELLGRD